MAALTVTDDPGAFAFNGQTVYPLSCDGGSPRICGAFLSIFLAKICKMRYNGEKSVYEGGAPCGGHSHV